MYLDKPMRVGEKVYFLSRPRRFGKTLLVDTLDQYFSKTQDLFKNTEIFQRHPDVWPCYPTYRLDFSSGISFDSAYLFSVSLKEKY